MESRVPIEFNVVFAGVSGYGGFVSANDGCDIFGLRAEGGAKRLRRDAMHGVCTIADYDDSVDVIGHHDEFAQLEIHFRAKFGGAVPFGFGDFSDFGEVHLF